jgi:hypothetical protein
MTLKELIEEKNKRLESVPDAFFSSVKKAERDIYLDILEKINKLETKDGKFILSKKNLLIVEEINDELKEVVLGSDYLKAVKQFASEFDTQMKVNNKYFVKAFKDSFTPSELAEQMIKTSKRNAVASLIGDDLNSFLSPLKDILAESINAGNSFKDTVKAIREFVEGNEDVDGRLSNYAKQIAVDTFAISDREYTGVISDELESEWFVWSGGIIEPVYSKSGKQIGGTRCFCYERNAKYYHYKEIEAWGGGDAGVGVEKDCGFPWSGMNENTNAQTIWSYAGGYNCQHSIMPVSVFNVPKDVIERNLSNGNFNPDDALREALGF